jgi:hypothetical protein
MIRDAIRFLAGAVAFAATVAGAAAWVLLAALLVSP